MTSAQALSFKVVSWMLIAVYLGWAALVICGTFEFTAGNVLMCGNSVTDPLQSILSVGTPASLAAACVVVALSCRRFACKWAALAAPALTIGCTALLLYVGILFFRIFLPEFHLSDLVWWLRPFGKM